MGIFEANITELEKKYPLLTEEIKKIDIEKISSEINVGQSVNGVDILQITRADRIWRLNSKWNPDRAAAIYAERYSVRLYQIYYVFGCSDGKCVREILKKCDDTNYIFVCEPDIRNFYMACRFFDLQDLITDSRVFFYLPEVEKNLDLILGSQLDYSKTKLVEFCILPGYDILYHDACQDFMDSIIERIRNEVVHKSTRMSFDRMIPQHTLFHMKNLIYHRNIGQLKQALDAYDLAEVPAIIVSAGPSLDKNIDKLKKAQGRAFIMVVDAAARTVLRAGIRPDLICTIDPESPDRFFEGLDFEGIFWSCTRLTRPEVVKTYAHNIFYHGFFYAAWNKYLGNMLGYPFPDFVSGGCVSAEAFILAMYLGFTKIILMGQDMAFTNGISHTKGIEGAFGDNDEYIQSRYCIQVEGIDGTMLETDFQMWYYKQWFEKVIQINKKFVKVLNATEGGARIAGAENCSLEDAVSKECRKELDIYRIEQGIPNAFSAKQQEVLKSELKKIKQQIQEFTSVVDENISEQEKLLDTIKSKQDSLNIRKEKLKGILEQNKAVAEAPILSFVSMYAQKEEYEIGDEIYVQEEMTPAELLERSITLLKGYRRGAALLQEDIDEFIMKE